MDNRNIVLNLLNCFNQSMQCNQITGMGVSRIEGDFKNYRTKLPSSQKQTFIEMVNCSFQVAFFSHVTNNL